MLTGSSMRLRTSQMKIKREINMIKKKNMNLREIKIHKNAIRIGIVAGTVIGYIVSHIASL